MPRGTEETTEVEQPFPSVPKRCNLFNRAGTCRRFFCLHCLQEASTRPSTDPGQTPKTRQHEYSPVYHAPEDSMGLFDHTGLMAELNQSLATFR